jgi:hypothetical protein
MTPKAITSNTLFYADNLPNLRAFVACNDNAHSRVL